MVSIWPRTLSCDPRGRFFAIGIHDAIDIVGDGPQIAVLNGSENIDGALDVVVGDHSQAGGAAGVAEIAQNFLASSLL